MSRQGMVAALAHGARLPRFASAAAARRALFALRDRCLEHLRELAAPADVVLDGTPGSLGGLEWWYFELQRRRAFKRLGTERRRFEAAMGVYVGAVAVRSARARWIAEEFVFTPGAYSLGVRRGLMSIMGVDRMCLDWHARPNNRRQQALYRKYRALFPDAGARDPGGGVDRRG